MSDQPKCETCRWWRAFWDGFLIGLASPILLITGGFRAKQHSPREQEKT